jgi:hypothetical protein
VAAAVETASRKSRNRPHGKPALKLANAKQTPADSTK